jgi:predicted secreted protein
MKSTQAPANRLSRRSACVALAGAPLLASPLATVAQEYMVHMRQGELEGMKLKGDGIDMDFPRLADTGSAVPLSVKITAPAGLKIALIEIFLPENPHTRALKLRLPEPQASYNFSTRLRLAGTQEAWVVATMTDGSKRGASKPTIITSSACFDGS